VEANLGAKLATVGVLVAGLTVALLSIGGLVGERQARRNAVIQDIAHSSSGEQLLTGPILIVPYEKTVREWRENDRGDRHLEEHIVTGELHFLPETFRLDGSMRTELRARGIYQARLYHASLRISAAFDVPLHYGVADDVAAYRFGQAFIALGVSDIRGIESPLTAMLDEAPLKLLPGTGTELLQGGLHAYLAGVGAESAARLELAIELPLLGTSEFHVIPVGRETQVELRSNWPYPGFTGDFLPVQRRIDANGFSAQWATSFFSTNLGEALRRCAGQAACGDFTARQLGVSFVDPVDQYLKTDRAIKYALLFIGLTFAGFFLFDVLKRLPVHPIQYGLVGAALAVFYLLLLSLSEHVGFGMAYLLSATGCVALIAFYVSHVLHSPARGIGFGCGLAVLYGCLFGLLSADDYALLMGSLLVFALLTAVMILTRRLDWSSLGSREESGPADHRPQRPAA
jgi:inner membrane protein